MTALLSLVSEVCLCLLCLCLHCSSFQTDSPSAELDECPIIMHSFKDSGVAIYTGREFARDDFIEVGAGFSVPNIAIHSTELNDFAEVQSEHMSLVSLGIAHLLNHVPVPAPEDSMVGKRRFGSTDSNDVAMYANMTIALGSQLFIYYSPTWFTSRGLDEPLHPCLGPGGPLANPFCQMSRQDVYNATTRLPGCPGSMTENRFYKHPQTAGMYAKRDIRRGQVIETARALLLPEDIYIDAGVLNAVLWKAPINPLSPPLIVTTVSHTIVACLLGALEYTASHVLVIAYSLLGYEPDYAPVRLGLSGASPHALLLFGNGALYRGSAEPNLLYYYYRPAEEFDKTGQQQNSNSIKPGACRNRMLVAFEALRDIAAGEELTVELRVTPDGRRVVNADFAALCMKSYPLSFRARWDNLYNYVSSYIYADRMRKTKLRILTALLAGSIVGTWYIFNG